MITYKIRQWLLNRLIDYSFPINRIEESPDDTDLLGMWYGSDTFRAFRRAIIESHKWMIKERNMASGSLLEHENYKGQYLEVLRIMSHLERNYKKYKKLQDKETKKG